MAITDAIKLDIYNGALRRLGSRPLASLTEARHPRRVLDGIWGADDNAAKYILGLAEWNFSLRTVQGVYSTSVEPPFGFRRAFDKPDDFVRLVGMSGSERLTPPLTNDQYVDEAGFWFADADVIYARYVSSGSDYGLNSALWPENFKQLLELYLAEEACEVLTNSTGMRDRIQAEVKAKLSEARALDGLGEGVKFLPRGTWVRSRYSSR